MPTVLLSKGPSTPCCSNPYRRIPYHQISKPHDVPKEHISVLAKDFWFCLSSTSNQCSFRPGWISCLAQSTVPMHAYTAAPSGACLGLREHFIHASWSGVVWDQLEDKQSSYLIYYREPERDHSSGRAHGTGTSNYNFSSVGSPGQFSSPRPLFA